MKKIATMSHNNLTLIREEKTPYAFYSLELKKEDKILY